MSVAKEIPGTYVFNDLVPRSNDVIGKNKKIKLLNLGLLLLLFFGCLLVIALPHIDRLVEQIRNFTNHNYIIRRTKRHLYLLVMIVNLHAEYRRLS